MVTQKDIAQRLGVSASLVSRVLAGSAEKIGASRETIRRIREEAARMDYRPSAAALSLRGATSQTIGVIAKDFEDPFFGRMIGELQSLAVEKDYSLIPSGCFPLSPQSDLNSLVRYRVDGIAILGSDFPPEWLKPFSRAEIPVVQIGSGPAPTEITRVMMDDELGIEQLIGLLLKLGHRDIGYIGNNTAAHIRREQALRAALRRHGLVDRPNAFAVVSVVDFQTGFLAINQLLEQCADLTPTAVIAADDVTAQGALRALFEKKIEVPREMSIAGIDDIPSARLTIPALTTLRQPIREMVREAFNYLTDESARTKPRGSKITVDPELVVRESCGGPCASSIRKFLSTGGRW